MNGGSDNKRILFVGLNTVDLQFFVNHYPESNTKTKAEHNEVMAGGPATNAAIACAYLGSQVDLYTPVGRHSLANFILEDISRFSIRIIDPIAGSESNPVFASIITSQRNGERTVLSYHPDNKNQIKYDLNFNLKDYSLVMFDGFHPELSLELAKKARELNIPTVLDGGSWKPGMEELLRYTEIAICSNDFRVPGATGANEIFHFLHARGVKKAAITRGEKSIIISLEGQISNLEVPRMKVTDTLGAGDILHGAFCHYLCLGENFTGALQKASIIASRSCESKGTRAWMK